MTKKILVLLMVTVAIATVNQVQSHELTSDVFPCYEEWESWYTGQLLINQMGEEKREIEIENWQEFTEFIGAEYVKAGNYIVCLSLHLREHHQ